MAQGIEEELKTYIDFLYLGPTRSRVDKISTCIMQLVTVFDNFSIKY